MLFTLCPAAFAASPETGELPLGGEYVTVSDDEGNLYTVWVEVKLHRAKNSRSSDGSLNDGRYYEGDQVEIPVRITNAQLDLGDALIGSVLGSKAKDKLGKIAGEAMSKKVGKFLGRVGTVAAISSAISRINVDCGNEGFEVTGTFEWTHFQHQIQGIDVWDWGLVGVNVDTY
ncbi:MAG: hypothetical protein U0K65_06420 [Negativibacillus sp.]|nr:hypothetical protein [Negativibacillus sp.]